MLKGGIRHPSFAGRFRACAHNPCRVSLAPSASTDLRILFIIHVFLLDEAKLGSSCNSMAVDREINFNTNSLSSFRLISHA